MADSPGFFLGSLLVYPGAVAAAAAPVQAVSVAVLETSSALPSGGAVAMVGQQACSNALLTASRLVLEATISSSDGLSKLGQALAVAAVTYRRADSAAVVWSAW